MLAGSGARVLLVGTAQHRPGSQLPSVRASVTDLTATLVECCQADPERMRTLIDPSGFEEFGQALHETAAAAEDVLVVCSVGHGLLDAAGEPHCAPLPGQRSRGDCLILAHGEVAFDHAVGGRLDVELKVRMAGELVVESGVLTARWSAP